MCSFELCLSELRMAGWQTSKNRAKNLPKMRFQTNIIDYVLSIQAKLNFQWIFKNQMTIQ